MQDRRKEEPQDRSALSAALGHSASDKRIDILRGIGRTGSISQAAREAGVSYKAAWQAVATLTNLAGVALVERVVGGAGGGGARLTAQGDQLLQMAQAYDSARRALAVPEGAATLGAGSAVARLRVRTSMRNQLPGTLEAMDRRGRQVRVQMRLGEAGDEASATRLTAAITQESAELLGLEVGLPAIALCKATAVRVLPLDSAAEEGAGVNVLSGAVARVSRAQAEEQGDELAVLLAGCGLELVGFAAPGVSLRRRQRVWAQLQASAVVLALPG